ncbi:TSUP family transporter [Nocardioides sp. dk4132]|uniref:sulfite exporter TauE/SafE family protein n=1 Tax=unclassified Nocardioides TaxID=2615069 RepID=UPI0012969A68|nr:MULTISPECIES: sulfite exporter TauE/SafE family protein [unclassified Nocardioides]MQW75104.1 TSUP family transporter [Nocardioides sp. dk4132]QGA07730.1 TSUP family transporter [Nocardioides sp. dk884]
MGILEALAITAAGVAAGTINTIVGSGTLITFPTLLAFGVPPVTANASNTIGLVPGSISGAWGYRRELRGQRARVVRLGLASLVGGTVGAVLLLVLPADAFERVVPVLIALGVLLVLVGPRLSRWVARRHGETNGQRPDAGWVVPAAAASGVYGGYFGAAQGVILMGILGIGVDDSIQRLNAVKNVAAGLVNAVAGLIFAVVADVDWLVVLLIAVGAVIGGQIGASYGRRLPPTALRAVIVTVGVVALVSFAV